MIVSIASRMQLVANPLLPRLKSSRAFDGRPSTQKPDIGLCIRFMFHFNSEIFRTFITQIFASTPIPDHSSNCTFPCIDPIFRESAF